MMHHWLCAHLHAAAFGRDLVLLDVQSGEYELLAGAAAQAIVSADCRALVIADPRVAAHFTDLGLFGGPLEPRVDRAFRSPQRSVAFTLDRPIAAGDRGWMAAGWLQMLRHYHGRPFADLLIQARRGQPRDRQRPISESELIRKAQVFNHLSIWTPFAGDCLYRSFMLLRLLGDDARDVDWIFGVRTWPFLAHCWLQSGDLVLTDPAEKVALFSPILVA